ncbi:hypothetical protein [Planococcus dechangensis]|uniref:2'-5' RNA ligase family protein n=1 Tax=Planococcus dechangensis TaxID=1176255 RepID=A0ABV9MC92_9BACL
MQLLVLRLDYHSSSELEKLQKQLYVPNPKNAMQLPHIPLIAYEKTSPLHLKQAIQPVAQISGYPLFTATDIGFSKEQGLFYFQVHPDHALIELFQALQLASRQFLTASSPTALWRPYIPLIDQVQAPFWGPLFARLALEATPVKGTIAAIECWSVAGGRTTIEWSIFLDS